MTRIKAQKAAAKKLLKKPAGPIVQIDLNTIIHPDWMTRCFRNNRYVVMIDDNAKMSGGITATKAMVQRHDDKPIVNHWREMQKIKNTIFGKEATAIEYYPAESSLSNEANIYWMWVFKDVVIPLVQNYRRETQ